MFLDTLLEGLVAPPRFIPLGMNEEEMCGQLRLPIFPPPRQISRPIYDCNDEMAQIQQRIVAMLRRDMIGDPRGISAAHNAQNLSRSSIPNTRSRYLYIVDIKKAYQSVDLNRLVELLVDEIDGRGRGRGVFAIDSWLSEASFADLKVMVGYCEAPEGGLIQGGAASPYLFHFYMQMTVDQSFRVDRITGMPRQYFDTVLGPRSGYDSWDIGYSRYADDMVFFSPDQVFGKRKRALICERIRAQGFEISTNKTRVHDLAQGPTVINGVGVRQTRNGVRTFLPRDQLRRLQSMLHLANAGKSVDHNQIFGLMGQFFVCTRHQTYNATEQRVLSAYKRFETYLRSFDSRRTLAMKAVSRYSEWGNRDLHRSLALQATQGWEPGVPLMDIWFGSL